MAPVLVDGLGPLAGIPGAAGPSADFISSTGSRVFVLDDFDINGDWGWTSAPLCAGAAAGTLTLSYDDTTARVVITGSNIDPYTVVMVERSTDQVLWTTVRGGSAVDIVSSGFRLLDYEFTPGVANYYRFSTLVPTACATSDVSSITPDLTCIWIKSLTRPFLNLSFCGTCTSAVGDQDREILVLQSPVVRRSRSGVFPIVNRTYAVAVNDIRLGREWDVRLRSFNETELRNIDYLLASGDVLLIQVPRGDCAQTIEHGYVTAFDSSYTRHHRYRNRVVWDFAVQEVAPPGPDIVYAENTWQTIINAYGSWAAVVAAHATWASVLTLLPNPSEVIVP